MKNKILKNRKKSLLKKKIFFWTSFSSFCLFLTGSVFANVNNNSLQKSTSIIQRQEDNSNISANDYFINNTLENLLHRLKNKIDEKQRQNDLSPFLPQTNREATDELLTKAFFQIFNDENKITKIKNNLKKILNNYFSANEFTYKENNDRNQPAYLTQKMTEVDLFPNFKGHVVNTLTYEQKQNYFRKFTNKFSNFLINSTKTDRGFKWYETLTALKFVSISQSSTITPQNIEDLIEEFSTNNRNRTFLTNAFELNQIKNSVEAELLRKLDLDTNTINNERLQPENITDSSKSKIEAIFKNGINFGNNWNLNFSKEENLAVNKNDSVEYSNLELFWENNRFNLNPPNTNIKYYASLGNSYAQKEVIFNNQANFYTLGNNITRKIAEYLEINQENFYEFITFKNEANKKSAQEINYDDFVPTDKWNELKKYLNNIDFRIDNLFPYSDNDIQVNGTIELSNNVPKKEAEIHKFARSGFFAINLKTDFEGIKPPTEEITKLVENSKELDPIRNDDYYESLYRVNNLEGFVNFFNNDPENNQYFLFIDHPPIDPNLKYVVKHLDLKNTNDLEATINVQSVTNPNIKKEYKKIIKNAWTDNEFDASVPQLVEEVDNKVLIQFGRDIYWQYLSDDNRNKTALVARNTLKSQNDYLTMTLEEKQKQFKNYYYNFLVIQIPRKPNEVGPDGENVKEKIDGYYDELKDRLKDNLIKNSIDPASPGVQKFFDQIEEARKISNDPSDEEINFDQVEEILDRNDGLIDKLFNEVDPFTLAILSALIKNPNDIFKHISKTEKGLLYGFTGMFFVLSIVSVAVLIKSLKLNTAKFRLKKSLFFSIGSFVLTGSLIAIIILLVQIL